MPVERSAGIILYQKTPRGRRYLVIRSSSHIPKRGEFWDFPKGRLEKGETGIQTAEREAREEVGIEKFEIVPGFKETVRYFTWRDGKRVPKFVALFLARAKTDRVKLSWEHDQHAWLPYVEARERVSLPQMKKALDAAEQFLARL